LLNKHTDGRTSSFQNKVSNLIEHSTSSNKAELQKWQSNGIMKDANSTLKKVLYVRTILSTREELNLLDFYYPSMFNFKKNNQSIEEVMQDSSTQPALIVGTVGQGKSIALRYLAFYTLCKLPSIPVFLELRKLRTSTSLFGFIKQSLENIKLKCSEKLLKHLLTIGAITLFLDGFDEIKHENRSIWVDQIEDLHTKFSQFKIFVTTRPNTDIHHRHLFKNYDLSPLSESDRPNFIKKLVKKEEDQKALITKLSTASEGVINLLVTPLLMAFFVHIYQGRRKLPNSNSEFFDELFSTILSRHDGLKAAYDRPSKCGFTDKELKAALQSLAYQTRKINLRQLPELKLHELAVLSLNAINLDSSKADNFIYDVNNITCLLQKDGFDYRFVHDSVQEFYSASFVRDQEAAKKDFYEKYINDWHQWSPELQFLKYIDEVAYNEHFLIPSFRELGYINEQNNFSTIKKIVFIEILKASDIVFFSTKDDKKVRYLCFITREILKNWAADILCKFYLSKGNHEFQETISKGFSLCFSTNVNKIYELDITTGYDKFKTETQEFYIFNSYSLLLKYDLIDRLYESIKGDAIYQLNKSFVNATSFVEQKKKIGGVF